MSACAPCSPAPPPVALCTSAREWRYLSEGKLNIVFTHYAEQSEQQPQSNPHSSGPRPSHALLGRVLKISKSVLRSSLEVGATASSLAARLHFARDYVRCAMHPLFQHATQATSSAVDRTGAAVHPTAAWMDAGTIVWLDCALVAALIHSSRLLRPLHRVAAFSAFDSAAAQCALLPVFLFEDYTSPLHLHLRRVGSSGGPSKAPSALPPTVTLELKPKWGFLPSPHSAADITADRAVKLRTCRFCMHQHLKLQMGDVAAISGFCPLDLFSCSPTRVRRALTQLIATPQNNMRLFVRTGVPASATEGEAESEGWVSQVDLQDPAKIAEVLRLLLPGFAPPAEAAAVAASSSSSSSQVSSTERLIDFLSSLICSSPHLRTLLPLLAGLQSQLDCSDIEGVHPLYAQLCDNDSASLDDAVLWAGLGADSDGATPSWMREIVEAIAPIPPADASALVDVEDSSTFEYPPATPSSVPADLGPVCARGGCLPQPATASAQRKGKLSRVLAAKTALAGRIDALGETAAFEAAIARVVSPANSPSVNETSTSQHSPASSVPSLSALQRIRAFLLATTLKDVSIMITMQAHADQSSSAHASSLSDASSARVHHCVRLIDLECKSVSKMNEYRRLDRQIVDVYLQHLRSFTAMES